VDASRLKSIPLFEGVSDDELEQIAPFANEVSVEADRELVREGDFSYEFMVIEEGEAEVTRDGEHVADLGPGDFFGEMGLLERTLRSATVRSKTPMRVVTLTGWDLKRMERAIPEAVERVRETLEVRRQADEARQEVD
jgi:CRP-like cAMP-binding protein